MVVGMVVAISMGGPLAGMTGVVNGELCSAASCYRNRPE